MGWDPEDSLSYDQSERILEPHTNNVTWPVKQRRYYDETTGFFVHLVTRDGL